MKSDWLLTTAKSAEADPAIKAAAHPRESNSFRTPFFLMHMSPTLRGLAGIGSLCRARLWPNLSYSGELAPN